MQCDARTANLLDDLLCGGCPYERFWILIMRLDEFFDGPFQTRDALEDAAAQTFPSELAEEAFDDIEPRATGRREMDMKAGVSFQLILHVLVFVRGIVVHDQIDVQVGRRFLVNQLEKLDPFLMAVFVHAGRDDLPLAHLNGRKERGRSVALVVMRHRAATPFLIGSSGCVRSSA